MSRLHRHQQSLATLEGEDYPRQMNPSRPRRIQELDQDRDANPAPNYPLFCYTAFQWKYNVDEGSPWWKKIYFRLAWLPFARFSYRKVGIVPFERLEPDGSLSWKEQQGVFLRESDAERESARHPHGGYDKVALNSPEPSRTVTNRSHFPASTAYLEYERAIVKQEEISTQRFHEIMRSAQSVVDQFRARQRHA